MNHFADAGNYNGLRAVAQARSREIVVDREELEDARWFGRDDVALMLAGRHPEGLTAPVPIAIAHHIMRAWVERDIGFD